MLGTIVNAAAILAGGIAGLLIRGGLGERYKTIIMQAVGMSVILVGLSGAVEGILEPDSHPVLFIVSLAIGGIAGAFLDIEGKIKALGDFFEVKLAKSESNFSKGFVAASLLFCVGSMAILGAFESGTMNKHSILFAKAVIDGITTIILASTWGIGVLLSAATVFVYQGALTVAAVYVQPYLTADMLREISIVGGIMIMGLGIDMLEIKRLNVANLLPAMVVPVIYYAIAQ